MKKYYILLCMLLLTSCTLSDTEYVTMKRENNISYEYRYDPKVKTEDGKYTEFWSYQNSIVGVVRTLDQGYELYINGVVQPVTPCYFQVDGPILAVDDFMGEPAVTFYRDCVFSDVVEEAHATTDILYKGELLTKKLNVDEVSEIFSVNSLTGYVVKKDGKEYILYDNEIVSPMYEAIITRSCCTSPSYFVVSSDSIEFLVRENGEKRIVKLSLANL